MRILFSCDEYPPLCTGGIGIATQTVAEGLVRKGHEVYVVSGWPYSHNLPLVSDINGVRVYRLKYFRLLNLFLFRNALIAKAIRWLFLKTNLLALFAKYEWNKTNQFIKKIINKYNIELVELPDYNVLTQYVSNRLILRYPKWNVPVVARIHGSNSFLSFYKCGFVDNKTKINDINFLRSCSSVLSVSHFAAHFIKDVLNYERKIEIIYNPVHDDLIVSPLKIKKQRTNEIVFIGKLIETKGAFNLIKAFNKFVKKFPQYSLVLIGGGDITFAKAYASTDALSHIIFTGFIDNSLIYNYLDRATFAVLPSYFETLGLAAIEVLSRGNILLYTNTATGTEIINDGYNGFLLNPFDIDDILSKMIYVAENIDKLEYVRINAIQSVIDNFSESLVLSKLENYYLRVTNEYIRKNQIPF